MNNKKILLAEDESRMQKVVLAYLKEEGFIAKGVKDGEIALKEIHKFNPDLLVLDLMLPKLSGEEVCQQLRQSSQLPILVLTAKNRTDDKLNCFELGADDYLVKPFEPKELIARVKAILRRSDYQNKKCEVLVLAEGRIKIDFNAKIVKLNGKDAQLTHTEFKVLQSLIQHPNQVLSREQLLDRALGFDFDGFDRTIDTHIKNIRHKLSLKKDEYIITVYGGGYKFVSDDYE
ncbi:response regulator transcription factor [Fuchsiella alkaliacetigena]|uniref:response regulator transcription factor n=1 Tax=Fuchsiella alkaliacetigena TaxID=957042 RepID=UPI00200A3545|nr:response regulator transcription factor [Fuchsiella alkaliacetigena]MCK8825394.1 response regulator transcription factor [Fuchsiella alkaliacetigena]